MFLLWPTLLLVFYSLPYYFSTVLRVASARVYCDTSVSVYCNVRVYTVSLCMCSVSTLAFTFFKIIYIYAKRSGTWNLFLFLVVWQEFKSLSYKCFFLLLTDRSNLLQIIECTSRSCTQCGANLQIVQKFNLYYYVFSDVIEQYYFNVFLF